MPWRGGGCIRAAGGNVEERCDFIIFANMKQMCGRAMAGAGALRAVLLLLGAAAVLAVDPTAWPTQFAIKFVSNITFTEGTGMPLEGAMYYDWTRQAQRVEHGAGAVECVHFYNSNLPCTIFFTQTGLYRLLQKPLPPGEPECCLDMPSIKASPPDWAVRSNATFNGTITEVYSKLRAREFSFPKQASPKGCHIYDELDDEAGTPLVFTFPAHDGRQDYHFIPNTFQPGPQDPSLFALPDGCENKLCKPSK